MFINSYHELFLARKVNLEQQHGFVDTGIQASQQVYLSISVLFLVTENGTGL